VEILAQSSAYVIFRALIYWAHRAVVPALAWHLVMYL